MNIKEKFIKEMLGEEFLTNPFEFLNHNCYGLSENCLNFYLSEAQAKTIKEHIKEMLNDMQNNISDYLAETLSYYVNDVLRIAMKEDIKELDDDLIFEIKEELVDYMLNILKEKIESEEK